MTMQMPISTAPKADKQTKVEKMPDWPARMGEEMAALYMGISQTGFRARVDSGVYPAPRREGGRIFWARKQLDIYIDEQFGLGTPPNSWDGC